LVLEELDRRDNQERKEERRVLQELTLRLMLLGDLRVEQEELEERVGVLEVVQVVAWHLQAGMVWLELQRQ
jgi:hypothetical protein